MLQHERDQRLNLEEMVEQLARQHSHLEAAAKSLNRPSKFNFFFKFIYIGTHNRNHIKIKSIAIKKTLCSRCSQSTMN